MAHSCYVLKKMASIKGSHMAQQCVKFHPPQPPALSVLPSVNDWPMGEYKSQTSTLPQSGTTLWYHLCSQLWVESDRLRPEFDCKSIFAPFLSWPYLTSLLNRLLAKNLCLRFFLWGAKTIFFSYNVSISSPFLLSLYISIEHNHTTAFSSKYI